MSPARTNSRSGILPPGSIASKGSALPSRYLRRVRYVELITSALNRSRSTTQSPETRNVGSGSGTTMRLGTSRTHSRTNSYASSTRTASRTPNGYSSATIGPGPRPASSIGMSRPHSSATARRHHGTATTRPASSLDTHVEEPPESKRNKRNGMQQFHFLSSRSTSPIDGPSPCNPVSQLTLGPLPNGSLECKRQPMRDGPIKQIISKVPLPATPVKKCMDPPPLVRSKSPSKRNPPQALPFLTKDSMTRSFNLSTGAAWDQDSREKNMEAFFDKFMSRISQTGQESYGLKEAVELYKSRGKQT